MNLSVIIPCFNEAKRLPRTLKTTIAYLDEQSYSYEIIIVDDGSTDSTLDAVDSYLKMLNIKPIRYEENRGKGYAVQQGVFEAEGEILLFMDADNATPISELEKLLPELRRHQLAIGSRYVKGSDIRRHQPWYRRIIGRMGNRVIQTTLLPNIKDTQCGFKVFYTPIAKALFNELETQRFGFDIEILYRAHLEDLSIAEVPVSWIHQNESRVRPFKDSFRTLKDLLRIRKNLAGIDKLP